MTPELELPLTILSWLAVIAAGLMLVAGVFVACFVAFGWLVQIRKAERIQREHAKIKERCRSNRIYQPTNEDA